MQSHKVDFNALPWMETSPFCKAKVFSHGNNQIRLVEFREGFEEPDWCRKGHAGIVMEGALSIDFDGHTERFIKGDVFHIPKGGENRHKAVLGAGERATLLLFETLK